MKTLITAAVAATLLAVNAGPAMAGEPDKGVKADATTIDVPASQQATPFTEQAAIPSAVHAPMAPNRGLELPSMATLIQPADPGYDQWRAAMDAARGKRRRGMILTLGGLLGGPLVGGAVAGGSAAAGSEAGIPDVRTQVKVFAAERGTTVHALVCEGLNMVFAKDTDVN